MMTYSDRCYDKTIAVASGVRSRPEIAAQPPLLLRREHAMCGSGLITLGCVGGDVLRGEEFNILASIMMMVSSCVKFVSLMRVIRLNISLRYIIVGMR